MATVPIVAVLRWLWCVQCVALLVFATGCDSNKRPQLISGGDMPPVSVGDSCATPREGCACDAAGSEIECGEVDHQTSGYVSCNVGKRVCAGGTWGTCVPTGAHTMAMVPPSGDQRLQGYGSSVSCASSNPCDPWCNSISDTSTGLTFALDAGVTTTPAGVTLVKTESTPTTVACTTLSIAPLASSLTVTQFSPVSPNTKQFTATVSPSGCYPGTPPVLWAIDRFDIATIDTNGLLTLVSPIAGTINVTAYAGSLSATTTLSVNVSIVDTSSAPSGTSAAFPTMTGAADTATVLYPYANTVLPLGLLPPLLQWSVGANGVAAAVKVSVRYPATGTAIFDWSQIIAENRTISLNPPTDTIALTTGPRASIPAAVWAAFERTAKGQDALIVLQRLTGVAPVTTLRAEVKTPIHFGTGQLKGTVYYQSYGTNLVQNFSSTYSPQTIGGGKRFGAATLAVVPGASYPTVAAGYTSSTDGPGCRVCHVAAAGGSVIVSNLYGSSDAVLFRPGTDAANGGLGFPLSNTGLYAWSAVYPDGTMTFGNSGPSPSYGSTAPPGGMDGSAWVSGAAPANQLYSTVPATLGTVIPSIGIPSALRAAMPVFSPDGTKVAFNHYSGTVGTVTGDKRSLGMMDFNVLTKTFSNFRRLVTQSTSACSSAFGTTDPCTNVWPTFLPGNEGVVFEREIFNNGRVSGTNHADFGGTRSGCDGTGTCGDDGTKAELWWVTLGTTPVAARMNQANGLAADNSLYLPTGSNSHTATNEPILNYEPTMSPKAVGGYYWVAFTSRRLYGNVATLNPWWSDPRFKPIGGGGGPTTKKIWLSAVDTTAAAGADPSHPAFYLPGQELLAGNSKAYWVLDSCKAASNTRSTATECESDLDCCNAPTSAVCSLQTPIASPAKRHCIPVSTSGCIADGSVTQCSTHAQCCNFSTGSRCANAVCTVPPPLVLYSPGTLTRDFTSECVAGKRVVWQVAQWQALIPTGTSISLRAATSTTSAGLATATSVLAGTASPPDTTTWATNPINIETQLQAIGQTSRKYLRLAMTMNPSSDALKAPTLTNWRVIYDCLDSE
ncbi:MAG: hypothetical protein QM756_14255 [Polyangiaceae bacterium]